MAFQPELSKFISFRDNRWREFTLLPGNQPLEPTDSAEGKTGRGAESRLALPGHH